MRYFVTIDGHEHVVELTELPGGRHAVSVLTGEPAGSEAGPALPAEVVRTPTGVTILLAGRVFDIALDGELPDLTVWASGRRAEAHVESARMRDQAHGKSRAGSADDGTVTSPMPGKVVKLLVKEGDSVEAGAPVVVVEAMKMENELVAPRTGVVQKVFVQPGDAVESGARLVTVG